MLWEVNEPFSARRAEWRTSIGTTPHCNSGERPVPITGTAGMRSEHAQVWRTTMFSHSLKTV